MMKRAIKLENIEEIDLTGSTSRSPSVDGDGDGDDDALVLIQPKQYRRLRFPPGCPVVRTCWDIESVDISFGVVKEAFVDLDTEYCIYRLDSDQQPLCHACELHFGRKAPIWLRLSNDLS